MKLTAFIRFHAREGRTEALARLVRAVLPPSRAEPGCLAIEAYRSVQDPALFFINSVWVDEAAFERHAQFAHTSEFLAAAADLLDHPPEIARTQPLGDA